MLFPLTASGKGAFYCVCYLPYEMCTAENFIKMFMMKATGNILCTGETCVKYLPVKANVDV